MVGCFCFVLFTCNILNVQLHLAQSLIVLFSTLGCFKAIGDRMLPSQKWHHHKHFSRS